ncbi:MAG: galactose-1-phosphate uridylyltransferase [Pirellulales bacterium]|nr:galactose-1-phosphate uridylyltransferase [Pirellulales bacterium]
MSLLRFDPTTSDWVVYAPSRALRPHDHQPGKAATHVEPANCPFCPGNESLTPPEIYTLPGDANYPGRWRVRVMPNKFPALRIEDQPERQRDGELFHHMPGCGAHEVVIESPDHNLAFPQQPVEQIEAVLGALQFRHRDLMRDRRFQTVVIFKNHGVQAGTSLAHPHWQLIATPVVPRLLRLKMFEATEYFDRMGRSLYEVMLEQELAAERRVLVTNDDFVAFLPYASHTPFETWILPRRREATFLAVDGPRMHNLAALLKRALLKLHTALDNPAYNLTIDSAPRGDEDEEYFSWHIRILPRLSTPAGFELGSGMSINTVLPEEAVAFLTEVATANGVAKTLAATTPDGS